MLFLTEVVSKKNKRVTTIFTKSIENATMHMIKKLLAIVQHSKRTKPPSVIIQGKRGKFRLKKNDLILSTNYKMEYSLALNIMLFLSFQISHTIANQNNCIIDHRSLAPPPA